MRLKTVAVAAIGLVMLGCTPRDRINTKCEWNDPHPRALDLTKRADRRHLDIDADVANELAVAYGDAFRHEHGMMVELEKRRECMTHIYADVARYHGVTAADVSTARENRFFWYDFLAVWLPMGAVLAIGSRIVSRRIFRHFLPDRDRAALVATGVASLVVAALALSLTDMYSFTLEGIRIGNIHVSFRGFYRPVSQFPLLHYQAALAIFWIVATIEYLRIMKNPPSPRTGHDLGEIRPGHG